METKISKVNMKKKEYYTEELEKSPEEKFRTLQNQKQFYLYNLAQSLVHMEVQM